MIRVYTRVSSDSQTTDSQLTDLRKWLHGKDEKVKWYKDEVQGDAKDRPAYSRLCKEARKGDTVVCWSLDRLSREGIVPVLQVVKEFNARGCRLVSVSEPWADSDNPVSEIVLAVLAWAAQQEKRRIKERITAGIQAAREKNGGKCPWGGRKVGEFTKRNPELDGTVRELKRSGKTVAAIARLTKLSRPTVYNILNSDV